MPRRFVQPAIALVALVLGLSASVRLANAQPPGITRTYASGWNLVALPTGTPFPSSAAGIFTQQPGDNAYRVVDPAQLSKEGFGYWVYLTSPASVTLASGSELPYSVLAPAGQVILIGNPSGSRAATVTGADVVLAYDPTLAAFAPTRSLYPGQGAAVFSTSGGVIGVTPGATAVALPPPVPGLGAVNAATDDGLDGTETPPTNDPTAIANAVAICADGWLSHDRKDNAACAHHGGVIRFVGTPGLGIPNDQFPRPAAGVIVPPFGLIQAGIIVPPRTDFLPPFGLLFPFGNTVTSNVPALSSPQPSNVPTFGAIPAAGSGGTLTGGGIIPIGATAICNDGTFSFSQNQAGACAGRGGVFMFLTQLPP